MPKASVERSDPSEQEPRRSSSTAAPPKPLTASAAAALHIRRLIFDGQLKPGEVVPPAQVAADLGISRIPVREAIVALEREGLLTIIPHRGAFVAAIDEDAIEDHFELYGVIFGLAAERAAARATPEVVARLAAAQASLAAATEPREVYDATWAFNLIVLEVGGSPRLRAIASTMGGLLPGNMFELIPETVQAEKRGTASVLKMVRNKDGAGAFDAYRTMLRFHGDRAKRYVSSRGLV